MLSHPAVCFEGFGRVFQCKSWPLVRVRACFGADLCAAQALVTACVAVVPGSVLSGGVGRCVVCCVVGGADRDVLRAVRGWGVGQAGVRSGPGRCGVMWLVWEDREEGVPGWDGSGGCSMSALAVPVAKWVLALLGVIMVSCGGFGQGPCGW